MDGGSLRDMIEDRSLYNGDVKEQQQRILDIAIQFARGLHYAHGQGLIHQDVKPDNLMLNKNGEAKVTDFGIAKARAELTVYDASLLSDGTIVSKSGYAFSEASGMAVKQDAPYVLTADKRGVIWLRKAKEDGSAAECVDRGADILDICLHPDGSYVLTACKNHSLMLWDISSKKMLLQLDGHQSSVHSTCSSPDGCNILSGGYRSRLERIKGQ